MAAEPQVALPSSEESFLAYSSYFTLAAELGANQVVLQLVGEFRSLSPSTQAVLLFYVFRNVENRNQILKNLTKLTATKETLQVFPASPDSALRIGQLLEAGRTALSPGLESDIVRALQTVLIDDADARRYLATLLLNSVPDVPIRQLFSGGSLDFVSHTTAKADGATREGLFSVLTDPVSPVVFRIARELEPYKTEKWIAEQLDAFANLRNAKDREAILQSIAKSLYRPVGYYSPGALDLFVFEASSLSAAMGLACATLFALPWTISAVALGTSIGRMLLARDRLRALIIAEMRGAVEPDTGVFSIEITGRQALVERLVGLSNRGWSTIGIVGRRGVGKSRVLAENIQEARHVASSRGGLDLNSNKVRGGRFRRSYARTIG